MEAIYELSENTDTTLFYGVNNANILLIKALHPGIRIVGRGTMLKITGNEADVNRCAKHMQEMEEHCLRYNKLTENNIRAIIKGENSEEATPVDHLILHGVSGKSIIARTENQRRLVKAFSENDLLFAIGPAGSGKTYTAIALAVRALKNR